MTILISKNEYSHIHKRLYSYNTPPTITTHETLKGMVTTSAVSIFQAIEAAM